MRRDDDNNSLTYSFLFSDDEQKIIMSRLWELLKLQVYKHNGVDSTSVPLEKVQDILESLLYTMEVAIENGVTKDELLQGDLSNVIRKGQNILREKKKAVKVEWKLLCQSLPGVHNVYYISTIKNISMFFDHYEIYYEAHQIPCSIDYWPLYPISEKLKGISYIEEYIHRLQIENDFLNCFDCDSVSSLYQIYIPDYAESLFNLCEPVLNNAIGLGMIRQDIRKLNVSASERNAILHMLENQTPEYIQKLIGESVKYVSSKTGMTDKNEVDYLIKAASGLQARVYEALRHQDLSHIFISFKDIYE